MAAQVQSPAANVHATCWDSCMLCICSQPHWVPHSAAVLHAHCKACTQLSTAHHQLPFAFLHPPAQHTHSQQHRCAAQPTPQMDPFLTRRGWAAPQYACACCCRVPPRRVLCHCQSGCGHRHLHMHFPVNHMVLAPEPQGSAVACLSAMPRTQKPAPAHACTLSHVYMSAQTHIHARWIRRNQCCKLRQRCGCMRVTWSQLQLQHQPSLPMD